MSYVSDPVTGLRLWELSHVWGFGVPAYPGRADVQMKRNVRHAQHGVLAWKFNTSMHTGTHMVAPIHMVEKAADLSEIPAARLFGTGVVLSIPKGSYETITAADLEKASPSVKKGDFVVINTGWHHKYSDALEYFGEAPGLTRDAAQWLVEKEVNLVAMDTPFIDHPLATNMGPHRGGPQMRRLADDYRRATGKDPSVEHGEFFVAHKLLAGAGILTVLQVGGDVDDLNGQTAAFAATPWKFRRGDACQIRFVAMQDPAGTCRIDSGND